MALQRLQTYGEALFDVYADDLSRLERWLRRRGSAETLTTLVRRFVRGRLRYGPERRGDHIAGPAPEDIVRFWDPAKAWRLGDLAIFPEPATQDRVRAFAPRVGQIVRVQGNAVTVRIDGRPGTQVYGTTSRDEGGHALVRWRQSVEDVVRALPYRSDEASLVDYALYCFGEAAATNLLSGLQQDVRFVVLEGQWFLRSLAAPLTRAQLEAVAEGMLGAGDAPLSVADLLPLVPPPVAPRAEGLYGLALSLREHPDLFAYVEGGMRSRWVLANPPSTEYVARLAAFDPETLEVLCEPGERLDAPTVQRLWSLDLLRTVVAH